MQDRIILIEQVNYRAILRGTSYPLTTIAWMKQYGKPPYLLHFTSGYELTKPEVLAILDYLHLEYVVI